MRYCLGEAGQGIVFRGSAIALISSARVFIENFDPQSSNVDAQVLGSIAYLLLIVSRANGNVSCIIQ
jgi:hypothetical protein